MDCIQMAQERTMAGSYEHDNETLGYIKGGTLLA